MALQPARYVSILLAAYLAFTFTQWCGWTCDCSSHVIGRAVCEACHIRRASLMSFPWRVTASGLALRQGPHWGSIRSHFSSKRATPGVASLDGKRLLVWRLIKVASLVLPMRAWTGLAQYLGMPGVTSNADQGRPPGDGSKG